jgi:hypothetical protein
MLNAEKSQGDHDYSCLKDKYCKNHCKEWCYGEWKREEQIV